MPLTPLSKQHFGSCSKQFTAACILKLNIDLNADIHRYLPKLPPFTHNGERVTVTVQHLLNMRSGLPEVLVYGFLRGIPDEEMTIDQKLAPLYNQTEIPLAFKPDKQELYCNTNYYLLAKIAEEASKQPLRDFAQQHIFGPQEMNDTGFVDQSRSPQEKQVIPGYEGNEQHSTKNTTWGACGVVGTPEDMVLWDNQIPPALLDPPQHPLRPGAFEYGNGLYIGTIGA